MNRWLKKAAGIAMSTVLLLNTLPALASETTVSGNDSMQQEQNLGGQNGGNNETLIYAEEEAIWFNPEDLDLNLQDDETLFANYANSVLYGSMSPTTSKTISSNSRLRLMASARRPQGANLTGLDRVIYSKVAEELPKIAAGQLDSSVISVPVNSGDFPDLFKQYTAADLGVSAIVGTDSTITDEAKTKFLNQIKSVSYDGEKIMNALLADFPYEMYWMDKTSTGGYSFGGYSFSYNSNYVYLTNTSFETKLCVSADYSKTKSTKTTDLDTSLTSATASAKAEAEKVVAANAAKSDYEKIQAYKAYIIDAVDYNNDAASNSSTAYGNPWQLIWVFDKDQSTKVVCEGYSKAFQYLMNLSDFSNENIASIIATGTMSGGTGAGGHMWNIVTMDDGKHYLVDVTNSDSGTVGSGGGLFIRPYTTKTSDSIYQYSAGSTTITYTYDADMFTQYDGSMLAISDTAYVSLAPAAAPEASVVTIDYIKETAAYESASYELNTKSDFTGTALASGASITDYIGGSIYVRARATAENLASASVAVTVPERPAAPQAPEKQASTKTSITLKAQSGVTFGLKEKNLTQTDNIFSGLTDKTEYTFYAFIPATTGSFRSADSAVAKIKTGGNQYAASLTIGTGAYVYDGEEKKPEVTVTYIDGAGTTQTIDAADYQVAYENNVNAGTDSAQVTVTIKSDFGGDVFGLDQYVLTKTFSIGKALLSVNWTDKDGNVAANGKAYDYNAAEQSVSAKVTYNGTDAPESAYSITVTGNKATNAGDYTAKAVLEVKSSNFYASGTEYTLTWKINDKLAPVISGIEDNATYYGNKVFGVTDDVGVKAITVDGTAVSLTDGQFTLAPKETGTYTITAEDAAGNMATVQNVKVYPIISIVFRNEKDNTFPKSVNVNYGGDVTLPDICSVDGYDQKWWAKEGTEEKVESITNVTQNQTYVAIYKINTYNVTLPTDEGYTITPLSTNPVEWNSNFSFKVEVNAGFKKTDGFQVTANGTALSENADGSYTIRNVKAAQSVEVSGIVSDNAPSINIQVGTNSFRKFVGNVTFGLFFKEDKAVTVTAQLPYVSSDTVKIYYIISENALTESQVKALDAWTEYNGGFYISDEKNYVIYVKAANITKNVVSYASSDGMVIDKTLPSVTDLSNGGAYYGDKTFGVSDSHMDFVEVDGSRATPGTDGKYVISADNDSHTVRAVDKAGNESTYTFSVYKQYKVNFVAGRNGENTIKSVTVGYNQNVNSSDIPAASEITSVVGYDQTAPFWSVDGTNPLTEAELKNVTGDITVKAVYTINTYTVKFVVDGNEAGSITKNYGTTLASGDLPAIPAKTGYDKTAPVWENVAGTINADRTVTAKYTINTYHVVFAADGRNVQDLMVNYLESVDSSNIPAVPQKAGYNNTDPFWSLDGTNVLKVAALQNVENDITVNAVYTADQYEAVFYADDVEIGTITVTYGIVPQNIPAIPRKEGYDRTAPTWDITAQQLAARDEEALAVVRVNAKYTLNTYRVTIKASEGAEYEGKQTVSHGSGLSFKVNVKEGYSRLDGFKVEAVSGDAVSALSEEDGVYTLGNVTDDVKITVSGTGDVTAPAIDEVKVAAGQADATIEVEASDAGSGVDYTKLKVDNDSVTSVVVDNKLVLSGLKADTDYQFSLTVFDKAGNGTSQKVTFRTAREMTTAVVNGGFTNRVAVSSITEVSGELKKAGYQSATQIQNGLAQAIQSKGEGYETNNREIFDAKLQISTDGGKTWEEVTKTNFPAGGLKVVFPYPNGTYKDTHDFVVVHMIGEAVSADPAYAVGKIEMPDVVKTDAGIEVVLHGLSPVAISWKLQDAGEELEKNDYEEPDVGTKESKNVAKSPKTSDSSNLLLWSIVLAAVLGMGCKIKVNC